jgi:hypothetical protein
LELFWEFSLGLSLEKVLSKTIIAIIIILIQAAPAIIKITIQTAITTA